MLKRIRILLLGMILVANSVIAISQSANAAELPKVDGTTGAPLGGAGTGAVKFRSNNGTFSFNDVTPTRFGDYASLDAKFQFYSNRSGTIVTNDKLAAVVQDGRYDDDAAFPVQSANFGVINNVDLKLTAFAPWNTSNIDEMALPYAFYEIKVTNSQSTPVDVSLGFSLKTGSVPTYVSGKGFKDETDVHQKAVYAKSNDPNAAITVGSDNGFFTSGKCNNTISGTTNRTAAAIRLDGNQTKYIQFVFAWYNNADPTRYYYTSLYQSVGGVCDKGLERFEVFKDNAVDLVGNMRSSNIPDWIVNPTLNSLCNYTNNSIYTQDKRYCHNEGMYVMNGTMDQMWHTRFISSQMFPDLAWQELEYWARTQKTSDGVRGQIHHDFTEPNKENFKLAEWDDTTHPDYRDIDKWVDLNCGFIITVYETFIATDNQEKLSYFWPYVKAAGQRILDQVTLYGDSNYPYTFKSAESSYDAGGNPQSYPSGLSIVTYQVLSKLAQIMGDSALQATYDQAYSTASMNFEKRWLSNNFTTGSYCEAITAGPWIANFLKFDQFWSGGKLNDVFSGLNSYYKPIENGMGYLGGSYGEWQTYLVAHYGGLALQTGRKNIWYALQHDMYERGYNDRNRVFNQGLGIPAKVTTPNYVASSNSGSSEYISIPVLWRLYYDIVGFHRDKHSGALWIEPNLPDEMNHTLTNGYFISPESNGTVSCTESGKGYQNQNIMIKTEKSMNVTELYVKDKYSNVSSVKVNDADVSFTRIGSGDAKEIKIQWTGAVDANGVNISVTGDPIKLNAFEQIEAEDTDGSTGTATETCSEGGSAVSFTQSGSTINFSNVDFFEGANTLQVRVANSQNGGNIELRLDEPDGTLAAVGELKTTGGSGQWETQTVTMNPITGKHNIYLKYVGSGSDVKLNWIKFVSQPVESQPAPEMTLTSLKDTEKVIQAEEYSASSGVQTENCTDTGAGSDVTHIHSNGDFTVYNLDFGIMEPKVFEARVACSTAANGKIEVRLNSYDGPLVGTLNIPVTGGAQTWTTASCSLSGLGSGEKSVYLVYTGNQGINLFNLNWIRFSLYNDDFSNASLDSKWSWIREDNTKWSLTNAPGSMRITSQRGDIYSSSTTAKNILLQNVPVVYNNFTITTKMTVDALPSAAYQQMGLIVYQDDDNYVKFVRGNGSTFEFGGEINRTFSSTKTNDTAKKNTMYLRIAKQGNVYKAAFSTDGNNYSDAGTYNFSNSKSLKFGVINIDAEQTVPNEISTDFDYFYVSDYPVQIPVGTIAAETFFTDYQDNVLTALEGKSVVKGKAYIINAVDQAKPMTMIAGLYEKDANKLVSTAIITFTIEKNSADVKEMPIPIPVDGKQYQVRLFLWDSCMNMLPYCKISTIE